MQCLFTPRLIYWFPFFNPRSTCVQGQKRPEAMASQQKAGSGKGKRTALDHVERLWQDGLNESEVCQQLKREGYQASRISQLIKATRPPHITGPAQASTAAAATDPVTLPPPAPASSSSARAANHTTGSAAVSGSGGQGARGSNPDHRVVLANTKGSGEDDTDSGDDSEEGVYTTETFMARLVARKRFVIVQS